MPQKWKGTSSTNNVSCRSTSGSQNTECCGS
jgi:hypothetical protein